MEKLSGIEELRRAVNAFDRCNEEWLYTFSAIDLLKLFRAWRAADWDLFPDTWTGEQIHRALTGQTPDWSGETEDEELHARYVSDCPCGTCVNFRELEKIGEVRIRYGGHLSPKGETRAGVARGEFKLGDVWSIAVISDDDLTRLHDPKAHDDAKLDLKRRTLKGYRAANARKAALAPKPAND